MKVNAFSLANFFYSFLVILVGMYLAGRLNEFDASAVLMFLTFGFGLGFAFYFLEPLPGISEKTCPRLHIKDDGSTVVGAAVTLWIWVLIFGSKDNGGHSLWVYAVGAAILLLFQKLAVLLIWRCAGIEVSPKCRICFPRGNLESSEDDPDGEEID